MWKEKVHIYSTPGVPNNFSFKIIVNNPFKENFYEKRKKKVINVLIVFSIFHKSGAKTFLKLIVTFFFLFFHKKFIKIFIKPTTLGQSLTFPFNKYYNHYEKTVLRPRF